MSIARINLIRKRHQFWLGIITLGLLVLLSGATARQLHSQGKSVTEIGSGTYQFVGRIDQVGTQFTAYGYLYDIEGLSPNQLFSDPSNPSETTAYFTYYATATLSSHAVLGDAVRAIFALDSVGEITYYYQSTPAASFDDPQSFAYGTAVTKATMQLQNILTVQGPSRGLANGSGELTVLSADRFTFGGENVRLGHSGKVYRVSTFGDAVRTDPNIPVSSVLLAGDAVEYTSWPPSQRH
jgi:hypothetical protein